MRQNHKFQGTQTDVFIYLFILWEEEYVLISTSELEDFSHSKETWKNLLAEANMSVM